MHVGIQNIRVICCVYCLHTWAACEVCIKLSMLAWNMVDYMMHVNDYCLHAWLTISNEMTVSVLFGFLSLSMMTLCDKRFLTSPHSTSTCGELTGST